MKLLLHICCAPCLIYPLQQLRAKGVEVEGVFYNPNIHPFAEYKKRKEALEDFSKIVDINIIYPDYNPEEFFQAIFPHFIPFPSGERIEGEEDNLKENTSERCFLCWQIRLKKTALIAKEKRFDSFSSTLLVSPYQNQEMLKKIGSEASRDKEIDFYYVDFRPGFRQARQEARSQGIYCQKYCGCIYSQPSAFSPDVTQGLSAKKSFAGS